VGTSAVGSFQSPLPPGEGWGEGRSSVWIVVLKASPIITPYLLATADRIVYISYQGCWLCIFSEISGRGPGGSAGLADDRLKAIIAGQINKPILPSL
jgi:hypothetical protein